MAHTVFESEKNFFKYHQKNMVKQTLKLNFQKDVKHN